MLLWLDVKCLKSSAPVPAGALLLCPLDVAYVRPQPLLDLKADKAIAAAHFEGRRQPRDREHCTLRALTRARFAVQLYKPRKFA